MGKFVDLSGKKFGKLTVIKREGSYNLPNGKHIPKWLCRCDCGNYIYNKSYALTSLHSKSCGCAKAEASRKLLTKYGMGDTRLASIWRDMRKRCYYSNCNIYKNYGGRGIKVCSEWKDDFMNFYNWAINNGYNDKLTIDRIDVNGNYEPSNCRWVTKKNQGNNRRNNCYLIYNNEKITLTQLANILNKNEKTISKQKLRGWSLEKILRKGGINDENILLHSRFL